MQNFLEGMPPVVRDSDLWPWVWLADHPNLWLLGWSFSFSLLGILLTHEFGHYFACHAHRIKATLPWVLPAPTLSGTAGAVIQIRSRIPDRNALMDVGLYGPLSGYIASIMAIAVGFSLSSTAASNAPVAIVRFGGEPLTIRILHALMQQWDPNVPAFDSIAPHPVLVAGWIGLFITSLNLIPGGQLDGGHVLYAISPKAHRILTNLGGLDSVGHLPDDPGHAPSQGERTDRIEPRKIGAGADRPHDLCPQLYPHALLRQLIDALSARRPLLDHPQAIDSCEAKTGPSRTSQCVSPLRKRRCGRGPKFIGNQEKTHINRSASTSTTSARRGISARSAWANMPRKAALSALREPAFRIMWKR
jgi:Zn-dependent protease